MSRQSASGTGRIPSPLTAYLREIKDTPLLSGEEERELASRVQQGDAASRDHLVRANLRLVVRIARQFTRRGMDLQDLIMEGNLGLLRAVEDFDPAREARFSTYATYWINSTIRRRMRDTGRTIRVPAYMVDLMRKWHQASARLQERLGRPPTEEEAGRCLNLSAKKLRMLRTALQIYNTRPQDGNGGGGRPPWEAWPDPRSQSPDGQVAERDRLGQVLGMLDRLEPREGTVLRLRFGLSGGDALTLREIGDRLGLTRERARQIEAAALRKLADKVAAD
jgi:RNA polymerase primary sigma factor